MRVFVTGASGFIGSAVVSELLGAGHAVIGLARSDESAERLAAAGAEVQRGSLEDLDALRAGARDADGVIHLAYIHDFSNLGVSAAVDERAIATFGDELAGSGRPFVIASGLGLVARLDAGEDVLGRDVPGGHRGRAAYETVALAERGVRSAVVGLAPSVHGEGDKAFVPAIIDAARRNGVSGYVGDGTNRWSALHRLDAARLFRMALESAPAGALLHATEGEGIEFRRIAEVIGAHLDLPVESVPPEHFGWLAAFAGADLTGPYKPALGWEPTHPGLLEDLAQGHYFTARASSIRAGSSRA
jgi:nucleoside-diphosphate-sugar epimerase